MKGGGEGVEMVEAVPPPPLPEVDGPDSTNATSTTTATTAKTFSSSKEEPFGSSSAPPSSPPPPPKPGIFDDEKYMCPECMDKRVLSGPIRALCKVGGATGEKKAVTLLQDLFMKDF